MGVINVLDKHLSELIAAGEVVDRPASVVKELVENSIDAGAKKITIEIKNGGIAYIRVSDDGRGIARQDTGTAFLRHATSKIRCEDDLGKILTMGFRGEALASISAVSRVELITRTVEEEFGTRMLVDSGETVLCEDAGCPVGTTIIVNNLFYNTPARMKFLKKDVTEGNAISAVTDKLALANPGCSFRFVRDGKEIITTPGDGELISTISSVYSRSFAATMGKVDYEQNGIRVSGYISTPESSRGNRSMQNFFINNRYIKSQTCMVALEEAYRHSIMTGKYPCCVLNIKMSAETVDVNVHPSKMEVRFSDERPVYSAVYYAVKSALSGVSGTATQGITQAVSSSVEKPKEDFWVNTSAGKKTLQPKKKVPYAEDDLIAEAPKLNNKKITFSQSTFTVSPTREFVLSVPGKAEIDALLDSSDNTETQPRVKPESRFANARIIGEALGTYIILENGNDIILIDKHAAHERLIYDGLKQKKGNESKQLLLSPVTVTLECREYDAIVSNLAVLDDCGFETDDFGNSTVCVRSVPSFAVGLEVAPFIDEIADCILKNKTPALSVIDDIYHRIACRSAIKAHDKNTDTELSELVSLLDKNEDVNYCPHGRPIKITLTKQVIEKMFGRV